MHNPTYILVLAENPNTLKRLSYYPGLRKHPQVLEYPPPLIAILAFQVPGDTRRWTICQCFKERRREYIKSTQKAEQHLKGPMM